MRRHQSVPNASRLYSDVRETAKPATQRDSETGGLDFGPVSFDAPE